MTEHFVLDRVERKGQLPLVTYLEITTNARGRLVYASCYTQPEEQAPIQQEVQRAEAAAIQAV